MTQLTRTLTAAAAALVAMVCITMATSPAEAQTDIYSQAVAPDCSYTQTAACPLPYPGPFTEPPEPVGAYGFGDPVTAPDSMPVPVTDPALAFTGAESSVIAYLGTGLLAFGFAAVAADRRLFRDDAES